MNKIFTPQSPALGRFLAALAAFTLVSVPVAFAGRQMFKPRPEVACEPALKAALAGAFQKGLHNTEYESWEHGAAWVVTTSWQIERGSSGVAIGRSKEVDALARASAKSCYALHLVVMEEFDGQSYVGAYRAWRASAVIDGMEGGRHQIDCVDFH